MRSGRFKAYRQLERSDCGITCVRMIARFYGKKMSLPALRGLVEIGKLGISLKDLTDAFAAVGMDSTALRISAKDVCKLPCPAIIYWRQEHFVVLYRIDEKKKLFYIADPAEGKMKLKEEEFKEYWTGGEEKGIVVLAEPGERFNPKESDGDRISGRLFRTVKSELKSNRKAFVNIILLSLLCMGADLLVPILMQDTVDVGIAERNIHLVWMLIAGQFMVFLGNSVSSNVIQYMMAKLSMSMNLKMTRQYLTRLVSFPLSFFDRKASADLIQKIDDQSRIKEFIMQFPNSTLFVVLNLIVFSGLMIWYNGWLFLFFLVMTLMETGWSLLFLAPRRGLDYACFTEMAENRNNVYEMINGMMEVKASGAHGSRIAQWEKIQNKLINLTLRIRLLNMGLSGGQSLIARIKEITITGICATLVIKGSLTFGEMLTVSYIVGRLSGPFENIIGMISQTQDALISYERLDEVLNDDSPKQGTLCSLFAGISLDGVSFRYPGNSNPFVINDMSLNIRPGQTTAIVGESGCGKTTLIKLMLGFYVPQSGRLELGGIEVSQLNRDEWLRNCGVVMQSGYIFSDTIERNIALEGTDIDSARVREVAAIAGLADFIESLPMRYGTRIGSSGVDLSGGQKQRLLIARALYKKPEILFLDEATSSLDATNERLITERILELQKGKTLIVAAHRLSTVRNADRILYMEQGRILEDGTHEDLIALHGRYYDLVSNQLELSV